MAKLSPLNSNTKLTEGNETAGFTISRPFQAFLNQIEALRVRSDSDQIGIHINDTTGVVRIGDGVTNYIEIGTNGLIRAATSLWWDAKSTDASSAAPGGSGATWTAPDANTLGGYKLDANTEKLYFNESISSMWDGASDLEFKVIFEVNVDNTGGATSDTVDLQLICYYKGNGDTANKTQTLEEAKTVGKSAQYKRFTTTFTIDWDATDNIVEVADKMSFILNLETDTSEVDDIIVNTIMFRYKTKKIQVEV